MIRYFVHHESCAIWYEDLPPEQFPDTDGLVEEIDNAEFKRLRAEGYSLPAAQDVL